MVLPAIQRASGGQIRYIGCSSLMQGYPFGTFLYWRVNPENSEKFNFFGFLLEYHAQKQRHCPPLGPIVDDRGA